MHNFEMLLMRKQLWGHTRTLFSFWFLKTIESLTSWISQSQSCAHFLPYTTTPTCRRALDMFSFSHPSLVLDDDKLCYVIQFVIDWYDPKSKLDVTSEEAWTNVNMILVYKIKEFVMSSWPWGSPCESIWMTI